MQICIGGVWFKLFVSVLYCWYKILLILIWQHLYWNYFSNSARNSCCSKTWTGATRVNGHFGFSLIFVFILRYWLCGHPCSKLQQYKRKVIPVCIGGGCRAALVRNHSCWLFWHSWRKCAALPACLQLALLTQVFGHPLF